MKTATISSDTRTKLYEQAVDVLRQNDIGDSTKPAPRLYPHQWLWDSCFIAIGLRHLDPERASREIISLFRGQWKNGMLPHEIFNTGIDYHAGPDKWGSKALGGPDDIHTTIMTQPPVVAEAVVSIGKMMERAERLAFYKKVLPGLIQYHEWLYRERDPHHTGLVVLIHPWECGTEDTPYWSRLMKSAAPLRVKTLRGLGQAELLDRFRPDLKHAPADQRPSTNDFLDFYRLLQRVKASKADLKRIAKTRDIPIVYDVLFNAILIRANQHLQAIASEVGVKLPADLAESIHKAPHAFETLYADGQYWARDFRTGRLLKARSALGFTALYAGTIPQSHADELAELLQTKEYWPKWGIASTPTDAPDYRPRAFWRGPVWANLNWLIADGLDRYGHQDVADRLRRNTLDLVKHAGAMYENFSALDGSPGGTGTFSWTAALVIDMLEHDRD